MILAQLRCRNCGHEQEDFVRSAGPFGVCPSCHGDLCKVFSPGNILIPVPFRAENLDGIAEAAQHTKTDPDIQAGLKDGRYSLA